MTDLRTHWMRTVHEALCGLSAKRLMLGERIIGGECATADVTCHGCRAVLRLAAMDAASGGPDDLRTLAQAYLDAREVDAVSGNLTASRRVTRTGLALGAALGTPTTVPPAAHAAAILAALDAADAQGYARAMGEVVEWCKTEARDEWRTWPRGPEYKSALADVARWAAAAEKEHEK